jgi:glycosyltransferase involved in cell wall biosynthesis
MLTLITATLNASRYIRQAFASVPKLPTAIQHVVVDGGSTDETIEICRSFPWIDTVVVPNCSIYEAWNIGIDRARGEWIMLLNADDELAAGAAETVATIFSNHPEAEIVAGRALMLDHEAPTAPPRLLTAAPGGILEIRHLAFGVPAINAMAFRRSLFQTYGCFDPTYRIAGDRAFLLRLALASQPPAVAKVDAVLYRYFSHSGSLTLKPSLEQRLRIARDHILLANQLAAERPTREVAHLLRYWRQREASVAALRCAAAGRPIAAFRFAGQALAPRLA